MRLRIEPRVQEAIQRLIAKDKETIALLQEHVLDEASGDPDVEVAEPLLAIQKFVLEPAAFGNFEVTHGLGVIPTAVIIEMTSAGLIWFQTTKYDEEKLYLVASEAGLTADAQILYYP